MDRCKCLAQSLVGPWFLLCVFEGFKNSLVILVTFTLAKRKAMDAEIEKEKEMAERK